MPFVLLKKNSKEFSVGNKKKTQILLSDPSLFSAAFILVMSYSGSSLSIAGTPKAKIFMAAKSAPQVSETALLIQVF